MKKIVFSIVFTTALASLYSFTPIKKINAPATYTVATDASKVEFTGSKKAGYHNGSFALKAGSISIDNGKLTGGKFVIDLASVKADAGEKLEGHLKSPDFFDVAKFAEATYEITSVNYGIGMVSNDVQVAVFLFANK